MRIPNWTKMSAEALWQEWHSLFDNEEVATATAVWCANRLVKSSRNRATRRKFYSIKDAWLERQESIGRRVRREIKECWGCDGDGCDRCGGSGNYSDRWLYAHEFTINGQRYSFHGYTRPKTLLGDMGEDAEQFGGNFTETELAELALPMSGLVKMLGYVAAVGWGMRWDGERYVKATAVSAPERATDIRYWFVGEPSG